MFNFAYYLTPKVFKMKKIEMYGRIESHGKNLLEIFHFSKEKDPVKLCKKLRRYENQATGLSEAYCNTGDTLYLKKGEAIIDKVKDLLGLCAIEGAYIFYNTDPRGYALKLTSEFCKDKKIYRDMGGYGILAPDFTPNEN